MTYNYYEEMHNDVVNYIIENYDNYKELERDDFEEELNDDLWTADSVTGNGSGSYTFSRAEAKSYVLENMDLLMVACDEFGMDYESIGKMFVSDDWESMDVTIRCNLLPQIISEVLDDAHVQ